MYWAAISSRQGGASFAQGASQHQVEQGIWLGLRTDNKTNLNLIYHKFRGVAWVNTNYFFPNRRLNNENEEINVDCLSD